MASVVHLICMTDPLSIKRCSSQKAEAQGIKPQEFVDKMANSYKELWKMLDVSYDRFIRTTDEEDRKSVV